MALYDNYEISVSLTEDHTEQEHLEEMEFLQVCTNKTDFAS